MGLALRYPLTADEADRLAIPVLHHVDRESTWDLYRDALVTDVKMSMDEIRSDEILYSRNDQSLVKSIAYSGIDVRQVQE